MPVKDTEYYNKRMRASALRRHDGKRDGRGGALTYEQQFGWQDETSRNLRETLHPQSHNRQVADAKMEEANAFTDALERALASTK